MRSIWHYGSVPLCILAAAMISSCGGGNCSGAGGAGMFCPEPPSGFAQLNGRALHIDGSPVAGKRAWAYCSDLVSVGDDRTDGEGNFAVRLQYSVADTVLYPYPPRAADGSFTLSCRALLQMTSSVVLVEEPVLIRFAVTEAAVVPTVIPSTVVIVIAPTDAASARMKNSAPPASSGNGSVSASSNPPHV